MTTFSEKNNVTHGTEMSGIDPGVEEQELAIDNSVEKVDATYLYKGTYYHCPPRSVTKVLSLLTCRIENTNGEVIEKYLVPCPTADPADPLVCHT